VREQVELYESSGGTKGTTLRDTGLPVVIVTHRGHKTGAIRKTPLMRVKEGDMIVAVVLTPRVWAVSTTSSHWAVVILSGQVMARTSSSRISAAVPGSERAIVSGGNGHDITQVVRHAIMYIANR
jgi:hypothetical protein